MKWLIYVIFTIVIYFFFAFLVYNYNSLINFERIADTRNVLLTDKIIIIMYFFFNLHSYHKSFRFSCIFNNRYFHFIFFRPLPINISVQKLWKRKRFRCTIYFHCIIFSYRVVVVCAIIGCCGCNGPIYPPNLFLNSIVLECKRVWNIISPSYPMHGWSTGHTPLKKLIPTHENVHTTGSIPNRTDWHFFFLFFFYSNIWNPPTKFRYCTPSTGEFFLPRSPPEISPMIPPVATNIYFIIWYTHEYKWWLHAKNVTQIFTEFIRLFPLHQSQNVGPD